MCDLLFIWFWGGMPCSDRTGAYRHFWDIEECKIILSERNQVLPENVKPVCPHTHQACEGLGYLIHLRTRDGVPFSRRSSDPIGKNAHSSVGDMHMCTASTIQSSARL